MISNMPKTTIVIFLCFITTFAFTQKKPMKFKKVDDELVLMTQWEGDTTAKAVYLGDFGIKEILIDQNKGWYNKYTHHYRIKILDKEALDLATVKIRLYKSSSLLEEDLLSLKAVVFTPENGKVNKTRFKRRNSFLEEVSDNIYSVNFTLPNVKVGSVIDIKYIVESPYLSHLDAWNFQSVYPKVFSELRTYIPEFFFYKAHMTGYVELSEHSAESNPNSRGFDYIEQHTRLRMENVPAFETEPYMNSYTNYISKIEHELVSFRSPFGGNEDFSSSWETINTQLLESDYFGKLFNNTKYLKEISTKIRNDYSDPKEQMVKAYEVIRDEMNWNGGQSIYGSKKMKKIWEEREGDSGDINMLLLLLLKDLGINADPVILSTRANGMLPPGQVSLHAFNYMVVRVFIDGEEFLLDATDKDRPYHLIPEKCINGKGRLISQRGTSWIDLTGYEENHANYVFKINPQANGTIAVVCEKHFDNYNRLKLTETIKDFDSEEDYMDDFEQGHEGMELNNFEIINEEDWSKPLIARYEYEMPDFTNSEKDILYINPLCIERLEQNPFRSEDRKFPVDFKFAHQDTYEVTINIPDGYTVEDIPENESFNMRGSRAGTYSSKYEIHENTVKLTVDMKINKPMFISSEYSTLRNFFSRVVEAQAHQIVLKKVAK